MEFSYIIETLDNMDRGIIKSDFIYPNLEKFSFPDFIPKIESKMRELAVNLKVKILDKDKFDSCAKYLYKVVLYEIPDTIFMGSMIDAAYGQVLSIVRQHPFNDGNKRIGMLTGLYIIKEAFFIDDLNISEHQQITLAKALYMSLDKQEEFYFREVWSNIIKSAVFTKINQDSHKQNGENNSLLENSHHFVRHYI